MIFLAFLAGMIAAYALLALIYITALNRILT